MVLSTCHHILTRLALLAAGSGACAQSVIEPGSSLAPSARTAAPPAKVDRSTFARAHAAWCAELHILTETRARALLGAVDELLRAPSPAALQAARTAWIEARRPYGELEVLRFQGGPIEPLEPFLNSWPVDESHLDGVVGAPHAGIVHDLANYPNPTAAVLRLANERGGEANVSTGWHAIEFLLWGQDLRRDGPGDRPARDYDPQLDRFAARRGACLRALTAMLVADLGKLGAAWATGAPHRVAVERAPDATLRAALTGALVLTAFELGGERLTVAYETRDQEQEHSCFSDNTLADLAANQRGILTVCLGDRERGHPGVVALLDDAPELATLLRRRLHDGLAALRAIPYPFDQAILGDDASPGRRALAAAILAMEQQTEALQLVGAHFGFELPLRPGQ